jgi:hypothetical protein
MSRIPIIATASRAYGFLLGEIGTIVRLTWAPLFIGSAFSYFYGGEIMEAAARAENDPSAAAAYLPLQLLMAVIGSVTGVMALVALLRVVVFGDRKPGLFVYLWLGAAELRLLVVSVLLLVAVVAASVGVGLVFALLVALSAAIPVLSVVLVAALVALVFAAIWVPLRLSLISPVVVAENSLGVERSWALMKGNALQMLFVLLIAYVPYLVVTWVAFTAILGADFPALPSFPDIGQGDAAKSAEAAKAASEAFAKVIEQWQLDLTKAMRAHWLEVSVLGFVGNVVSTALWAGVVGSAYAVTAGERNEGQS